MASLENKVVWITGASSGIGEGIVKNLAAQNVKLILSSRRAEALEEVKAACPNQDDVRILTLDLAQPDTLETKAKEALAFFGRVDVVIHSGGISQRSFALETDIEVHRRLMEVNYFSTIILTKALLPSMIQNGFGHIVAISSLVGKFGSPYRSGYSASKHALHGYYDSLRAETWKQGIKVTIATPGFIKTNVSVNALTEHGEKLNSMDQGQENGMSAEECGRQIVRAIIKEKEEVRIGGKETMGILVKRFLPGVFSKMIRKMNVR
ncbi:MAG: SDR family oxidoreductase [Cyclobacteriaceae bacterium]|nr:SDR family oxidoreductase [Cyclobacteriaceae bacterium]